MLFYFVLSIFRAFVIVFQNFLPEKNAKIITKVLKAEIDEEKIEAFKGMVSLPFKKGENAKIAVKIIDDRGIESLRVISL
jgi:hypothetical protein